MTWTATRTATRPTSPSSRSRTSGQSTRSNHHHQLHLPSASSPSAGRISNSPSPTRNGNLPFLHENVLLSSNASTRLGASTINLSAFIQSPISILLFNRLLTTENPIRTVAIRSRSLLGAGTAATWAYHTSSCDVTRERKKRRQPSNRQSSALSIANRSTKCRPTRTGSRRPCHCHPGRSAPTCSWLSRKPRYSSRSYRITQIIIK